MNPPKAYVVASVEINADYFTPPFRLGEPLRMTFYELEQIDEAIERLKEARQAYLRAAGL